MRNNARRFFQCPDKLRQRDVTVLDYQFFKKRLMGGQACHARADGPEPQGSRLLSSEVSAASERPSQLKASDAQQPHDHLTLLKGIPETALEAPSVMLLT